MPGTYDKTLLAAVPLYRARFQLGDKGDLRDPETNDQVWLVDDDEISALIAINGYAEGVAQCADALAVRFAQEPDEYTDEAGVKVKWSLKIATWQNTAKQLRAGVTKTATIPVGGRPVSGKTIGPDMTGVRA